MHLATPARLGGRKSGLRRNPGMGARCVKTQYVKLGVLQYGTVAKVGLRPRRRIKNGRENHYNYSSFYTGRTTDPHHEQKHHQQPPTTTRPKRPRNPKTSPTHHPESFAFQLFLDFHTHCTESLFTLVLRFGPALKGPVYAVPGDAGVQRSGAGAHPTQLG